MAAVEVGRSGGHRRGRVHRPAHTGSLLTSMGEITATGRSVTPQLCAILEFRDGKVAVQRT